MSVYIKGMEMPRGCASCKISRRNGKKMICPFIWKCEWDIHDPMSADHRLDGCPLIPVPDHGRLIDADALIDDMANMIPWVIESPEEIAMMDGLSAGYEAVGAAPTIIPADPADKEAQDG